MKITVLQYKRKIQDLKNDAQTHIQGGDPGPVPGILSTEKDKVQIISLNSPDFPLLSMNNNRNTVDITVSSIDDRSVSPLLADSGKTKFPLI